MCADKFCCLGYEILQLSSRFVWIRRVSGALSTGSTASRCSVLLCIYLTQGFLKHSILWLPPKSWVSRSVLWAENEHFSWVGMKLMKRSVQKWNHANRFFREGQAALVQTPVEGGCRPTDCDEQQSEGFSWTPAECHCGEPSRLKA